MQVPKDSQTFCALPFLRAAVESDGVVRPCCTFENFRHQSGELPQISAIEPGNLSEVFYSPGWNKIREQMLKGESVPGCDRCYKEESRGMRSFRIESNEEFREQIEKMNEAQLRSIELYISNLCNLKCRTCSSQYSTQWTEDDAHLNAKGIAERKSDGRRDLPFHISQDELSGLIQLNLLGGEPFTQIPILKLLSELAKTPLIGKLQILVHTNGTVMPSEEVLQAFRLCRSATITLSVDGYREEFEYLRKNAKWQKLEEIAEKWLTFSSEFKQCNIELHPTASIYNMLTMPKLVEWWEKFCQSRFAIPRMSFGYCYGPAYLSPSLLPAFVKERIRERWTNWLSSGPHSHVEAEFEKLLKAMDAEPKAELAQFFRYTETLDNRRQEHISDAFPELFEHLQQFQNRFIQLIHASPEA